MKLTNTLGALLVGFSLAAAGSAFNAALADDKPAAASSQQPWLTIPQLIARLEAAGYRNIEEIEREDDRYEVRAATASGVRRKLYVHPQTGAVISERRAGRQNEYSEQGERASSSADCSERRCREDLPRGAPGGSTTPAK